MDMMPVMNPWSVSLRSRGCACPINNSIIRPRSAATCKSGERLASGATLSLRQRATGMETSAILSGQGNPTLTLPAGLLLLLLRLLLKK